MEDVRLKLLKYIKYRPPHESHILLLISSPSFRLPPYLLFRRSGSQRHLLLCVCGSLIGNLNNTVSDRVAVWVTHVSSVPKQQLLLALQSNDPQTARVCRPLAHIYYLPSMWVSTIAIDENRFVRAAARNDYARTVRLCWIRCPDDIRRAVRYALTGVVPDKRNACR